MRAPVAAAGGTFWVSFEENDPAPIRDRVYVEHDGDLRLRVTDPALELRVLRLFAYDSLRRLQKGTPQ